MDNDDSMAGSLSSRRQFIRRSVFAGLALGVGGRWESLPGGPFTYTSPYLRVALATDRPAFTELSTDSLGKGRFAPSPLMPGAAPGGGSWTARVRRHGVQWQAPEQQGGPAAWALRAEPRLLRFRSRWSGEGQGTPFEVVFSQRANHCTVLGMPLDDKHVRFPCILHFPGMGSFRLHCSHPDIGLFYDAELTANPYVRIAMPAADARHRDITYTWESVAIYPPSERLAGEQFDGYKRNYINIFQLSPRFSALANNSTSDACAFTLFLYAEMARATPPLAEGLHAMDLVRHSLERYLGGMLGYGMVGKVNWQSEYNSTDSFPSLIMSAAYYVLSTGDRAWAERHYAGVRAWAEKMIATDRNGDGIIEYGYSGNAGSWGKGRFRRPANWWDTIGFGHDDAYGNALTYRACTLWAQVADLLGRAEDRDYFSAFAAKLKGAYYERFYNPATGVLGGWRSADGQLHDYYFTFVNSIAVCYGLVSPAQGKALMGALWNKMKAVGYTDFSLGLPGNLIPIADEDYAHHDARWGYQHFQVYENGGATGCYVYYTIHALYLLGMRREAEAILFPMLESFREGRFEGRCDGSTMTRDWKTWTGECWGYEGFLVDNYLPLLAVSDYLEAADGHQGR